jgi:hypothetical protein
MIAVAIAGFVCAIAAVCWRAVSETKNPAPLLVILPVVFIAARQIVSVNGLRWEPTDDQRLREKPDRTGPE